MYHSGIALKVIRVIYCYQVLLSCLTSCVGCVVNGALLSLLQHFMENGGAWLHLRHLGVVGRCTYSLPMQSILFRTLVKSV